ncbi:MAG: hypothetical protein R3B99_17365 [Polyangiales bacterium]
MIREGDRVADYDVVARMKAGGMATLFLGRRTGASGFSKPVAIKVVHPHLADDPSFVEMFVDEALPCAHPTPERRARGGASRGRRHPPAGHGAMAGCLLGQLLRSLAKLKRRMTPELAVHVAIAVLMGFTRHMSSRTSTAPMEVVHRDVSPDNVLLAWQGTWLIDSRRRDVASHTDLGLDAQGQDSLHVAGAGVREERRPAHRRVCARDRALECLTMRRLFSGSGADLELLEQVRNPTIEVPSQFAADLPPALDAILLKALAKNPDERFRSARDAARARRCDAGARRRSTARTSRS